MEISVEKVCWGLLFVLLVEVKGRKEHWAGGEAEFGCSVSDNLPNPTGHCDANVAFGVVLS